MPVALPNVPFPVMRARVTMYSADRSGRRLPIDLTRSRYMPHLVAEGGDGEYLGVVFCGGQTWNSQPRHRPIASGTAVPRVDYAPLLPGGAFTIVEGPKPVGEGIVIDPPALEFATRSNGST